MSTNLRLTLALIAYAGLGLLVWRTMADDKVRLITFAILGMLTLRTITHAARLKREVAEQGQASSLPADVNEAGGRGQDPERSERP